MGGETIAPRTKIKKPRQTNQKDIDILTTLPRKKTVIPIESIIELVQKKLSTRQIAKILNCSHVNIVNRLQAYKSEITGIESFKRNRADLLAIMQSRIYNSITDVDFKKASLLQKTTAFGILHDKERLERGQSGEVAMSNILINIHQALFNVTPGKVEGPAISNDSTSQDGNVDSTSPQLSDV